MNEIEREYGIIDTQRHGTQNNLGEIWENDFTESPSSIRMWVGLSTVIERLRMAVCNGRDGF